MCETWLREIGEGLIVIRENENIDKKWHNEF